MAYTYDRSFDAVSLLHVKSFDVEQRTIEGIASTPEMDRSGDVVNMSGVTFAAFVPLLLHHEKTKPVGRATLHKATAEGIPFTATLPLVTEPGALKDRIDEAWHSVKAGLLLGVSIGFRVLNDAVVMLKSGGLQFNQTEVLELSLVTIPANASASIRLVKSLVASDRKQSAVADTAPKRGTAMTTAEQITQWSNARAPMVAKMSDMMGTATDKNTTFDEAQSKEYDDLTARVKGIDEHLTRLRALEASNISQATPIAASNKAADASANRGGAVAPITVRANVEKGTAFVRAACALLLCKGNSYEAAEYARKRWADTTPEVELYLKAAVAAGNTTDTTWALPLVEPRISNEFLELLRPATIIGKIPGLRTVPFNVKVPAQSSGGSYSWVGETKPKPVTKLGFTSETLGPAKAAGIIVLTEELVRLSNPSAEALVRADMIAGIAQFLDQQFVDPTVAAVTGVNPASITNGAPTAVATANPMADLLTLLSFYSAANVPVSGLTIILSEVNALSLSFQTNASGDALFPGVGMNGGSYRGINFVTSQAAGTNIIAVQPSLVLFADDGGVTIDASREASLQMDSAPDSPATATTVLVSLWQHNLVGLRAERFINWKRLTNAVKYLTAAAYPAPTGGLLGMAAARQEPQEPQGRRG